MDRVCLTWSIYNALNVQGKNADEAREWINAWREGSKGAAPPAAEAKSGTDASAAKSSGVKSEGVTKVQ